jgi:hypothetical protein
LFLLWHIFLEITKPVYVYATVQLKIKN